MLSDEVLRDSSEVLIPGELLLELLAFGFKLIQVKKVGFGYECAD